GALGAAQPDHVPGVHTTSDANGGRCGEMFGFPIPDDLSQADLARVEEQRRRWADMKAYLDLQSTRPRTLAYSLTDSPAGQLAWIAQSFKEWTAASAELPEDAVDRDQLLANVSIYWFTRSGASAARFIYETAHAAADWGGAGGGGGGGARGADRVRAHGAGPVRWRRPAPQGDGPRAQAGPLDRVRPRRPLRRHGGPGPARRRPPHLLQGAAVTAPVLTRRALNRPLLRRQALLERAAAPAQDMVGRLVAVQAQEPDAPYVGLWARLDGFDHDQLAGLLKDRLVVRSTLLRGTQHLVRADDYLWLRPLVQPALERVWRATLGRRTDGVDPAELASAARGLLAGRSLTRPQLRDLLAERWPDRDAQALAAAAQPLVPVVHPPPAATPARPPPAARAGGGAGPDPFRRSRGGARPARAAERAPEALLRRYLA